MIHPRFSFLAVIFTMVFFPAPSLAQQSDLIRESASTANSSSREKAFNLLESLAGETGSLQSPENRARMRSNIAASLWPHNEQRARTLLAAVEADIKAELQVWLIDGKDQDRLRVFLNLRMDTVERIAKHDAQLALAFLKATELDSDKRLPYGVVESQHAFELRLAKEIAAYHPATALKLSRESLARGLFSDDLLLVLRQLHKKDKERGLILYREIVDKIRTIDFRRNWHVMSFAQTLARAFRPPNADEPTFRDLINTFITSALAHCGNRVSRDETASFCWAVGSLMPLMESVDPLRAASLKQWAPNYQGDQLSDAYAELNDLFQNGTVEEILELTSKHPQVEFEIHWNAMLKAEAAGDVARAREIANRYQRDPERQKRMLAHLDGNQSWATLDDEKLAGIQRRLDTIPRSLDRVYFLISVAGRIGPGKEQAALKLLNLANEIVDTMTPGKEQTEAQIGVAIMYCQKKSDRGFLIMESLVPRLNELVSAAVKLDGYDNRYLRDSEWNMSGAGGVGSLLTALAHSAAYFASCDFDRSVSLAAQFERPEIRMMAQLKLAQGLLDGPKHKINFSRHRSILE